MSETTRPSGVTVNPEETALPEVHCGRTFPSVIKEICLALLPALGMAVYHFGPSVLRVAGLSVLAAVTAEALYLRAMKKDLRVDDFHAVYIGLLLAFMLPANSPWWLPVIGASLSIVPGKMLFGGLGSNPFCPPAIGWLILLGCWPALVDATSALLPGDFLDPLYRLKHFGVEDAARFSYVSLLLGEQMGGLGATQSGALLLGGLIMVIRLNLSMEISLGFILGVSVLARAMHFADPATYSGTAFHLLSGTTVFGAFFLATDFGSAPSRPVARLLYGMLAGILTMIIRTFSPCADGTILAILLVNLLTPYLELVRPRPFGA